MIRNFIKIAIRSMAKHRLHSFVNIFGLAIGLAATILIFSYVYFETSFDRHNLNYEHIYRLYSDISLPNGSKVEGPVTLGNVAPKIQDQVPEVSKVCRFYGYNDREVELNENVFRNNKLLWVDSTFFDIFSFEFIAGNSKTALTEKNTIVITESYAKRLFGDEDAFEKTLKFRDDNHKITGIIKDLPINSHFQFDMVGAFRTISNEQYDITKQNGFAFYTYLLCADHADVSQLEAKLSEIAMEASEVRFKSLGLTIKTFLQPLSDIHLKSNSTMELETSGDINNVYIFSALAIFIILIAIVNFVNLITANSESRAKEIGLRKVMGAFKAQLLRQFIGESILISIIAFILALGIAELFIDPFRHLLDSPIVIPYWNDLSLLAIMIAAVLVQGVISGAYPAFYLTRFLPVQALKGSKGSSSKNNSMRKALVVFQFSIAIFLLINLALLYTQVNFLKNKSLGFDKEQVLVLDKISNTMFDSYESLKADLLMNPNVVSVSASMNVPGEQRNVEALFKLGDDASSAIVFYENRIRPDYLKTYGIEIIEGRDFSEDLQTDRDKLLINEATVKSLGLENPVNQKVVMTFDTMMIIGVFRDYNFLSLHNAIEPLGFTRRYRSYSRISIKLNTKDIQSTLLSVEETVKNLDPNYQISYKFIDQSFNEMYQREERVNKLISYAAILSILISMLGLFALTSFTTQQRIREIGVRKVMGASENRIVKMFVYDLIKWVLIGAAIASPLAYYAMDKWLEKFVYHTQISIWMFGAGVFISLFFAVLIVSLISFKAARSNPAESLKYE